MPRDVWRVMLDLAKPRVDASIEFEAESCHAGSDPSSPLAWTSCLLVEVASDIFGYSQSFSLADPHDYSLAKWEVALAGGECNGKLPIAREGNVFVIERGWNCSDNVVRDVSLRIPCFWLEAPLRAALADAAQKGLPFAVDG